MGSGFGRAKSWELIKAHFTLGVKAKVELKSSISIGVILKSAPRSFTLGVKVGTKT